MSIDVRDVTGNEELWSRCVDRSPQSTVFHRLEYLKLMEDHSDMELHMLAGFKGEEPVGAFPFYVTSKGPAQIVYSPPSTYASYLGPILVNAAKLSRRKQEKRHKSFVSGCTDWLSENVSPEYARILSSPSYPDSRPFKWNDFDVEPRYTYNLDLQREEEEVKQSFSKSLRRYLDPEDEDLKIYVGGKSEVEYVYEQLSNRYRAQDRRFSVPRSFFVDIYQHLPDKFVQPYAVKIDGELCAGIVLLKDDTTCYFWQGGSKPDTDLPVNDILHWRIIQDAIDDGLESYDMYGANTERICRYKAKFSPDLSTYYDMEYNTLGSKLYRMVTR